MNNDLMTTDQAAEFLSLSSSTLNQWRSVKRTNLPYIKLGDSVRYSKKALIEYAESHTIRD